MKYLAIGLMSVSLVMIGLWYVVGGLALAVALLTLISVLLLLLAFGLGSWWSGRLMERGATIALKGHKSNGRRAREHGQTLAGLAQETIGTHHGFAYRPSYPSLPNHEEATEAQFTIAGLEED